MLQAWFCVRLHVHFYCRACGFETGGLDRECFRYQHRQLRLQVLDHGPSQQLVKQTCMQGLGLRLSTAT
jgi:hypothetical protein